MHATRWMKWITTGFMLSLLIMLAACGGSTDTQGDQNQNNQPAPAENGNNEEDGQNGSSEADLPATVYLGTEPVGGGYHTSATGWAALITDHTPMRAVVQPSSGTTTYMPNLNSGKLDFAIMNGPNLGWAYTAGPGYDENKNVRTVLTGKLIHNTGLLVREDSGITSLDQLKGKKVAVDYGTNAALKAQVDLALESVGLTLDDVVQVPVPTLQDGLAAIQNGSVDASMGGGPTTPSTMEVDTAVGLRLLPWGNLKPEDIADGVPDEVQALIDKWLPGSTVDVHPAGVGIAREEIVLIAYPSVMVSTTETSEDVVYTVTKATWENYEEMHAVHPWWDGWSREEMVPVNIAAPYHDGAIKFFKEIGVWTEEHQAVQDELLALYQ